MFPLSILVRTCALVLTVSPLVAGAQATPATPEVRRDGPFPAQAVGATHTLRIIPETCGYLRGRFTGDAAAPYRVDAVPRGGGCQPRARLRQATVVPSGAGWVLNDILQVPSAGCPQQRAVVKIWRLPGGNSPPAHDAQGRSRIYLEDAKRRAQGGALAQLGEYVFQVTVEGRPCAAGG